MVLAPIRCGKRSGAVADVLQQGALSFGHFKGQKRVRRPWRKTLVAKGLRHPAQLLFEDETKVGRAKRLKQYRFHRWRRA